jgi:predicted NAD-dependent protein-ADP-ribosyltransferase YbiA (DUF1768 family)
MATTPDNRPWAPHPIPSWVIKEFTRRQKDIGFEYPVSVTWDDNGTWQNYKGPMTAWVRVFSNGTGRINDKSTYPEKSGFVLQGGYGFDKVYGIPDNKNVLGYDSEGEPHTLNLSSDGNLVSFPNSISNDKRTVQKFLPVPGITSIDAIIQKERIRKITVNWKCYGYAQLEYMTPYFLSPKISAFVEFGWNHFNQASLLDLRKSNLKNLKELFTVSGSVLYDKNIKESYGLYDGTMGIVSGFDFSTQDGITFECKTEILSKHANYSGVLVNSAAKVSSDKQKTSVQSTFAEYLEKRLTKLPNCISKKLNFMSPLDVQEEDAEKNGTFLSSTFPFYKYNDGNYTRKSNAGKDVKRPEDRFFMGRKSENPGDSDLMVGIQKYDWDKSDQKDIWVTMGFLVELANIFFNKQINLDLKNANDYNLYEFTYDKNLKRGALTFSEVPYKIKELILERCMEKNAGLYVLIPDFKTFANKHGVETSSISKKSAYDTLVDTKKPKSQDYDDTIVIQVYNKSKHAKVGEGSGETIKPELKISKNVLELNNKKKYPEWRKKLDNDFLVTNLKIDGINWTSVKHYMLASRFNGITDIISKFKKDGVYGSNIEEAQKFYESQLAKKSIKSTLIDDEEFKKMEHTLLEKALYAKFTQNDELRELLLLTGNALITLFKPSKGAIPFVELMKVRKLITK